jgi:hypothetical protein
MRWKRCAIAVVVGLVVIPSLRARAQAPAAEPPSIPLIELGAMPRPVPKLSLGQVPAIQDELKLTAAQRQKIENSLTEFRTKVQNARQQSADLEKFIAARDKLLQEVQTGFLQHLEPGQRDRLDQIQLQIQGPLAFANPEQSPRGLAEPTLPGRLKLSDEQLKQIKTIVQDGIPEIEQAAAVPIVRDPNAPAPTLESVRKLVEGPEFKAAKQKTRDGVGRARAVVIQRIENVLTEPQRTAYRGMLGAPFSLSSLGYPGGGEAEVDARLVAQALGVAGAGGGQQSDPTFNTKVAHPAYTTEHPRVLFDEAHNNFHTSTGRYKPFAEIIANDGYTVIPNKEKVTKDVLARGNVLIIANALGAPGMGQPGAGKPAFTDAECDAIRDWVRSGGSLLLITDHAPFGSAAESLARRFDVDMSKGATSDPSNSEGGESWLVFSRKNKLLGDHPITQGRDESERVNRIQTFTGTSLKGPAGSVAILKLADTASDSDFNGKTTSAAGRAQGIAFTFGKGRVVVMGEAAELSAQTAGGSKFGMNVPGLDNRQMAINIMHWLSGVLEPRATQNAPR